MLLEHRNYALFNGFILGLIYCCMTLFLYFIDIKMLFSGLFYPMFFWIFFLLYPIYVIKKSPVRLLTFKEFFSVIFLVFFSATLTYSTFTWILYNIIDPSVSILYVDLMMERVSSGHFSNIVSGREINRSDFANNFSFKNQLNAYVFFLIPCVLYSSIISLIMKTRK